MMQNAKPRSFSQRAPVRGVRKRILIVNCYFDDTRLPIRRTLKFPQPMAPAYLAGHFAASLCDLRCYNEMTEGPLEDEGLLGWADMLVLTGLTNSFDRMRHLTAYARSKNPRVIVVAGGPAVRMLPAIARHVFDYACQGDAEEIAEVISDAFSTSYVAEDPLPRFDLAHWMRGVCFLETTRYCNFRCAFCALTAEGRSYQPYDLNYIRKQLVAAGRRKKLFFLDNNFYGSDRRHFLARLELLREMRDAGHFNEWGALVTNDFFQKDENLRLARQSGCQLLFSGIESFDSGWLRQFSKTQNVATPQVQLIQKCLDAGIIFIYGLIVDIASRTLDDLRNELRFVADTPEITLPCFLSTSIPLLGTPYFSEAIKSRSILPSTKLRDLDGTTITQTTVDPLPDVVNFVRNLQSFREFRQAVPRHMQGFIRRYARTLDPLQLTIGAGMGPMLATQSLSTGGLSIFARRRKPRSFVSTTEPLDRMYTPAFPVDSKFQHYFNPLMVTDEKGEVHKDLLDSGLFASRPANLPLPVTAPAVAGAALNA
jgi:radical SAM superfamily enzyme YgiQ (UPF0313 family)